MITVTGKEDKWKYIGFNDTWFSIIGIPLVSFFLTILFFNKLDATWFLFVKRVIGGISFTAMYWLGLRYLMQFLRKRYNRFEHTMKRLVIVALVIIFIGPLAGSVLNFILDNLAEWVNYERMYQGDNKNKVLPTYFACFFMIAVYEAIYFYYQLDSFL